MSELTNLKAILLAKLGLWLSLIIIIEKAINFNQRILIISSAEKLLVIMKLG